MALFKRSMGRHYSYLRVYFDSLIASLVLYKKEELRGGSADKFSPSSSLTSPRPLPPRPNCHALNDVRSRL